MAIKLEILIIYSSVKTLKMSIKQLSKSSYNSSRTALLETHYLINYSIDQMPFLITETPQISFFFKILQHFLLTPDFSGCEVYVIYVWCVITATWIYYLSILLHFLCLSTSHQANPVLCPPSALHASISWIKCMEKQMNSKNMGTIFTPID